VSKVVDKGLQILAAFTVERPALTIDELVTLTGVPVSTLYRFLHALLNAGYVTKARSGTAYVLGPAVLRLGRVAEQGLDVRAQAIPWMERLAEKTGFTVYLGVRLGASRLCLESREVARSGIRFSIRPGEATPLHAGAGGKVLLAFLPAADIKEVLGSVRLRKVTPRTVTSSAQLHRQLAQIREQGYHYSEAEYVRGSWGLAAPILDAHGVAVASLSLAGVLSGPASRPEVGSLARMLLEATRDISAGLGYEP
jgi:DNA-binding IclR family transcriptional regulator